MPQQVQTVADAAAIVEQRNLARQGRRLRHRRHHARQIHGARQILSALEKGFGFCDVVLGWDSNDQLYDNVKYTGWHTAYPDAPVRVLPDTCRAVPFEGDMVMFLGEFADEAEAVCPRGTLRRVLDEGRRHGLRGCTRPPSSSSSCSRRRRNRVRDKGFRDLTTMTPGLLRLLGAALQRARRVLSPALIDLRRRCAFRLEGLHTETGPGVLEAAIQYREALEAADKAALFKTFTKVLAQRNGWMATFMAKWSQGLAGPERPHPHSLRKSGRQGGVPRRDEAAQHVAMRCAGSSAASRQLMPELLAMVARTVNSYSRLIPGFWAPTDATWGVENRTYGAARHSAAARSPARRVPRSPRPTSIRISRSPRPSARASTASRTRSSRTRWSKATPTTMKFPKKRALPRTLREAAEWLKTVEGRRATVRRRLRRALRRQPRVGRPRVPQARSPTGNSRAISRSSEPAHDNHGRPEDHGRSTASRLRRAPARDVREINETLRTRASRAQRDGALCRSPSAPRPQRFCDAMFATQRRRSRRSSRWQMGRPVRYAPNEVRGTLEERARHMIAMRREALRRRSTADDSAGFHALRAPRAARRRAR